jgi:predicted DNA-binding transcriptional regulator YafY
MPGDLPMPNSFANSVKFLNAITLLSSPQGVTIKKLMHNLNISRRSVFRLLEAFEELGFPLIDEQPRPRSEKIYRLMESYVLKLPNMAIPYPGFSEPEIELLLSMLNFCINMQKSEAAVLLNGIRQKIMTMIRKNKKEE